MVDVFKRAALLAGAFLAPAVQAATPPPATAPTPSPSRRWKAGRCRSPNMPAACCWW
jgi:hypothetical protein